MQLVDVTVFYLEMRQPPRAAATWPEDDTRVLYVKRPSVAYYRFLYDAVGRDYHWLSRRKLPDEQLEQLLGNPANELHVVHVEGSPAGFVEFDHSRPNEIEIVQFGLFPEYIGRGLGKWFLHWSVGRAFDRHPERLWLHTCSLDHPAALPNYQNAGFSLYKQEKIRREL